MKLGYQHFGTEHGVLAGYHGIFVPASTLEASHKLVVRPADGNEIIVRLIPMNGGCWFLTGPLQPNQLLGILEAIIAHNAVDSGQTEGRCKQVGGSWSSLLITEDGELPKWMPIIRELQKL